MNNGWMAEKLAEGCPQIMVISVPVVVAETPRELTRFCDGYRISGARPNYSQVVIKQCADMIMERSCTFPSYGNAFPLT